MYFLGNQQLHVVVSSYLQAKDYCYFLNKYLYFLWPCTVYFTSVLHEKLHFCVIFRNYLSKGKDRERDSTSPRTEEEFVL